VGLGFMPTVTLTPAVVSRLMSPETVLMLRW
jgi:hypothetical protein